MDSPFYSPSVYLSRETPRLLPLSATQSLASGVFCGAWTHVRHLGLARPCPVSKGLASKHLLLSPFPWPGSQMGPQDPSGNHAWRVQWCLMPLFLFLNVLVKMSIIYVVVYHRSLSVCSTVSPAECSVLFLGQ